MVKEEYNELKGEIKRKEEAVAEERKAVEEERQAARAATGRPQELMLESINKMQDGINRMLDGINTDKQRLAAMEARRDKLRDEQRSHSHVPPAVDFGSSLVDGITEEYLDSLDWEGLIVMKKGAYALPLPYPQTNEMFDALTTAGFNLVEALSAATPALLGVILGLSPGGDGEASVASMVGGIFQVLVNMTSHGLKFHQDVHERSSGHSSANKPLRPDGTLQKNGWTLLRGEWKSATGTMVDALKDLRSKILAWGPDSHGRTFFQYGLAVVGVDYELKVFHPNPDNRTTTETPVASGSLLALEDRLALLRLLVNLAAFYNTSMRKGELASFPPLPEKQPTGHGNLTWVAPVDGKATVHKEYRRDGSDLRLPKLEALYAACSDVEGLERGVRLRQSTTFHLTPYCINRDANAREKRAAILQVAKTLSAMHERRFTHLDVRWPNIRFDPVSRRWILIDCEFTERRDADLPEAKFQSRLTRDGVLPDDKDLALVDIRAVGLLAREAGGDVGADIGALVPRLMGNNAEDRRVAFKALSEIEK